MEGNRGRGRGRGRGQGRGGGQPYQGGRGAWGQGGQHGFGGGAQQQQPQQQHQQHQQQPQQQQQQQQHQAAGGGGRGNVWGRGRGQTHQDQARQGAGDVQQGLAQQMEGMRLQQSEPGASSSAVARLRRPRGRVDVESKPEDFETKMGNFNPGIEEQLEVITNYFRLIQVPNSVTLLYSVDFNCEVDLSRQTRRKKVMLDQHKDKLPPFLFDGTNLYTQNRLGDDLLHLTSKVGNPTHDRPMIVAHITLALVGQLEQSTKLQQYNQFLNLVKNEVLSKLDLIQIRDNFFDLSRKVPIPRYGLEVLPGFSNTIRFLDGGPMLQTDVTSKIIRNERVIDIMKSVDKSYWGNEICGATVATRYNKYTCYVVNSIAYGVTPRNHTWDDRKTKERVQMADYYKKKYNITIEHLDYNLLLCKPVTRDRNGGRNEDIYLIPELAFMTNLSDRQRADFRLNQELQGHTKKGPQERYREIAEFRNRICKTPEALAVLNRWGLKIDEKPLTLISRMIKPLDVIMAHRGQANAAIPRQVAKDGFSNTSINGGIGADWTSLLRFVGVYTAGNMAKTGQEQGSNRVMEVRRIAFIYSEGIGLQAVEFWKKEYQAVCANIGLLINETEIKLRSAGRGTQRDWDRTLAEIGPNEFDFVFAMIDRQDEDLYYTIKTKLLVDKKMSNQVIVSRNVVGKGQQGPNKSILTKVAIQMGAKLGRVPWVIEPHPLSRTGKKYWMTIGYDTFHKKRTSNMMGKSFGAITFSYDRACSKYFSQAFENADGTEMANTLYEPIMAGFKLYKEKNGQLPHLILYYRDGVGEHQVEDMIKFEMVQIRNAIRDCTKQLNGEKVPELVIVLVNKRINTKIFCKDPPKAFEPGSGNKKMKSVTLAEEYEARGPKGGAGAGRGQGRPGPPGGRGPGGGPRKDEVAVTNAPPGTVVDQMVTRPEAYDFFLVPQSVTQGTVNPTAYSVILDEAKLGPSCMQQLTFALCHLYQNWPGTIRVPAPCMYAHKLAYLMGDCLKNSDLAEKLNRGPLSELHYFL